jgi:Leucine-rich repeat (LRR) protein
MSWRASAIARVKNSAQKELLGKSNENKLFNRVALAAPTSNLRRHPHTKTRLRHTHHGWSRGAPNVQLCWLSAPSIQAPTFFPARGLHRSKNVVAPLRLVVVLLLVGRRWPSDSGHGSGGQVPRDRRSAPAARRQPQGSGEGGNRGLSPHPPNLHPPHLPLTTPLLPLFPQCAFHGINIMDLERGAASLGKIDLFQPVDFTPTPTLSLFTALVEVSLVQTAKPVMSLAALAASAGTLRRLFVIECGLTTISGLDACTRLTHVCLDGNLLHHIPTGALAGCAPSLQHLSLNDNRIARIEGLEGMRSLRELHLARNLLSSLGEGAGGRGGPGGGGGGLEGLTALQHLAVPDNHIGSFRDVARLARLPRLRALVLSDPHWGDNPVCMLANYAVFAAVTLPRLEVLDGLRVTPAARAAAEATFHKKRIYYGMRMHTLRRNTAAAAFDAAGAASDAVTGALAASLPALRHAGKLLERYVAVSVLPQDEEDDEEDERKGAEGGDGGGGSRGRGGRGPGGGISSPPHSASSLFASRVLDGDDVVNARHKMAALRAAISARSAAIACVRDALAALRIAARQCAAAHNARMDLELLSGGNTRLEEGRPPGLLTVSAAATAAASGGSSLASSAPSVVPVPLPFPALTLQSHPGDPWFASAAETLRSRFAPSDFGPLHVVGIRVTRVVRVHNRHLRTRFEKRVSDLLASVPNLGPALATQANAQTAHAAVAAMSANLNASVQSSMAAAAAAASASSGGSAANASLSVSFSSTGGGDGGPQNGDGAGGGGPVSPLGAHAKRGVQYVFFSPKWSAKGLADAAASSASSAVNVFDGSSPSAAPNSASSSSSSATPSSSPSASATSSFSSAAAATLAAPASLLLQDALGDRPTPPGVLPSDEIVTSASSSSLSAANLLARADAEAAAVRAHVARLVEDGFGPADACIAAPAAALPLDYAVPPPPQYSSPTLNMRPAKVVKKPAGAPGDAPAPPSTLFSSLGRKLSLGIPVTNSLAATDMPRLAEAIAAALESRNEYAWTRAPAPAHMNSTAAAVAAAAAGLAAGTSGSPASSAASPMSAASSASPGSRGVASPGGGGARPFRVRNTYEAAYSFTPVPAPASAMAMATTAAVAGGEVNPVPTHVPAALGPQAWLQNAGVDASSVMAKAQLARGLRAAGTSSSSSAAAAAAAAAGGATGGKSVQPAAAASGSQSAAAAASAPHPRGPAPLASVRAVRSGTLVICRAFLGNMLDMSTGRNTLTNHLAATHGESILAPSFYGDPLLTPAGQAAASAAHSVQVPLNGEAPLLAGGPKLWTVLDPSLLVPEYVVDWEYVFEGEGAGGAGAAGRQTVLPADTILSGSDLGDAADGIGDGSDLLTSLGRGKKASPTKTPVKKGAAAATGAGAAAAASAANKIPSADSGPVAALQQLADAPVSGGGASFVSLAALSAALLGVAGWVRSASVPTSASASAAARPPPRAVLPPSFTLQDEMDMRAMQPALVACARAVIAAATLLRPPGGGPPPLGTPPQVARAAAVAVAHAAGAAGVADLGALHILFLPPLTRDCAAAHVSSVSSSTATKGAGAQQLASLPPEPWWATALRRAYSAAAAAASGFVASGLAISSPSHAHTLSPTRGSAAESLLVLDPFVFPFPAVDDSALPPGALTTPLVPGPFSSAGLALSGLTMLSLVDCGLTGSLEGYGLASLASLKHIDLSHNRLTALQGLSRCAALWSIDASFNCIATLQAPDRFAGDVPSAAVVAAAVAADAAAMAAAVATSAGGDGRWTLASADDDGSGSGGGGGGIARGGGGAHPISLLTHSSSHLSLQLHSGSGSASASSAATPTSATSAADWQRGRGSLFPRSVLAGCRFLQELDLSFNAVTAVAGIAVVGPGCPMLRVLDLRGNPLETGTPAGAASAVGAPGAAQAPASAASSATAPPASSVRAGGTGAGSAYFPVLVCALPGLDVLDGRVLTDADRALVDTNTYRLARANRKHGVAFPQTPAAAFSGRRRPRMGGAGGGGGLSRAFGAADWGSPTSPTSAFDGTAGSPTPLKQQLDVEELSMLEGGMPLTSAVVRRLAVDDLQMPLENHVLVSALAGTAAAEDADDEDENGDDADGGGGDGEGGWATLSATPFPHAHRGYSLGAAASTNPRMGGMDAADLRVLALTPRTGTEPGTPRPESPEAEEVVGPSGPGRGGAGGGGGGGGFLNRPPVAAAGHLAAAVAAAAVSSSTPALSLSDALMGARTVSRAIGRAAEGRVRRHPRLAAATTLDASRLFLSATALTARGAVHALASAPRLRTLDLSYNDIGTLVPLSTQQTSTALSAPGPGALVPTAAAVGGVARGGSRPPLAPLAIGSAAAAVSLPAHGGVLFPPLSCLALAPSLETLSLAGCNLASLAVPLPPGWEDGIERAAATAAAAAATAAAAAAAASSASVGEAYEAEGKEGKEDGASGAAGDDPGLFAAELLNGNDKGMAAAAAALLSGCLSPHALLVGWLSPLASCTKLQRLDLSRNRLTDAALALARLHSLPNLTHLSVEGNLLASFDGVVGCRNLVELYAGNNLIGAADGAGASGKASGDDSHAAAGAHGTAPTSASPSSSSSSSSSTGAGTTAASSGSSASSSSSAPGAAGPRILRALSVDLYPRLIIVDLAGNPVARAAGYREYALLHVGRLKVLDGAGVSSEEMAAVRVRYQGRLTLDLLEERALAAAVSGGGGGDGTGSAAGAGEGALDASVCLVRAAEVDVASQRLKEVDLLPPLACPRLSSLLLDHNALTNDGCAGLALLLHSPSFRRLSASHNKVTSLLPALGRGADGKVLPHVASALAALGPKWASQTGASGPSPSLTPSPSLPFARLETLDLSHNGITSMEGIGLAYLPNLRSLSLAHNDIPRITAGLSGCRQLRVLTLDGNAIRALDGDAVASLAHCPAITTLTLSDNGLRSIAGLGLAADKGALQRLTTLHLHANRLGGGADPHADLDPLTSLPALTSLTASNNPAARKPNYRLAVLVRASGLALLDGREILEDERATAAAALQGATGAGGGGDTTPLPSPVPTVMPSSFLLSSSAAAPGLSSFSSTGYSPASFSLPAALTSAAALVTTSPYTSPLPSPALHGVAPGSGPAAAAAAAAAAALTRPGTVPSLPSPSVSQSLGFVPTTTIGTGGGGPGGGLPERRTAAPRGQVIPRHGVAGGGAGAGPSHFVALRSMLARQGGVVEGAGVGGGGSGGLGGSGGGSGSAVDAAGGRGGTLQGGAGTGLAGSLSSPPTFSAVPPAAGSTIAVVGGGLGGGGGAGGAAGGGVGSQAAVPSFAFPGRGGGGTTARR